MSTTGASTDNDTIHEVTSEEDAEAALYERELSGEVYDAVQPLDEALASVGISLACRGPSGDSQNSMSVVNLRRICEKREMYEYAMELNEVLYLQQQGFAKIENLNLFRNCVCLFLNNNCISRIEGGSLSSLRSLKQIYLHMNSIEQINASDFENNLDLEYINISNNKIKFIGNLYFLPKLKTLLLANNLVSEMTSLAPLPDSLETLDFSGNPIEAVTPLQQRQDGLCPVEEEFLEFCGHNFRKLRQIYTNGCPLISRISQFRRRMILQLPLLCFLDKASVTAEDRILAEAWLAGGTALEMQRRRELFDQKRQAMDDVLTKFREFQANGIELQTKSRQAKECKLMDVADAVAQNNAKLEQDIRRILSN